MDQAVGDSGAVTSDVSREGLVGESPIENIQIAGKLVPCLIHTGSQVTMIKQSTFHRLFGEQGVQLEDPSAWLKLTAANGQNIPYVGCMEVDVNIGPTVLEKCGVIIVKDHCLSQTSGLLGMNIIRRCWEVLLASQASTTEVSLQANPLGKKPGRRPWPCAAKKPVLPRKMAMWGMYRSFQT